MYCFTCGYDVDQAGFQCQSAKAGHILNLTRNQAHIVWCACRKGHHKTLPDGTGAGMGWILANNLQKATYVIDKNQQDYKTWKAQQRTLQGGAVYEKSQAKTKQTCSAHNKLYPITNNSNYFALIFIILGWNHSIKERSMGLPWDCISVLCMSDLMSH